MSSFEYEVVVIGAGVIGSSTAYYLSKELGSKVALLEQFDFIHRLGSSHGESRIIRYTYQKEQYTQLMFDAYKLWAEAEATAGTKVYTKTGGLDFGSPDNPNLKKIIENAKKYKVNHEIFKNAEELGKRFPMIKMQPGSIAVYSPDSGILNASKAVSMFQQLAKGNKCFLKDNCPVTNITQNPNGSFTIETGAGLKLITKKCILTCGPWAKKMLKKVANLNAPLTPEEITVAYWKVDKPELYSSPNFLIFIDYDKETPILYGFPCHEFPNLLKVCAWHDGQKECDPDKRTFAAGMKNLINVVGPWLQETFEGVSKQPLRTESCICTETPDNDYIIDKVPGLPNMFVGCDFSGHGFKISPAIGKLLAEWTINDKFPYGDDVQNIFALKRFE